MKETNETVATEVYKRARAERGKEARALLERFLAGQPVGETQLARAIRELKTQRRGMYRFIARRFSDARGESEGRALANALFTSDGVRKDQARQLAVELHVERIAAHGLALVVLLNAACAQRAPRRRHGGGELSPLLAA
jgi:hypothetical protein